jgi:hypothetical protein
MKHHHHHYTTGRHWCTDAFPEHRNNTEKKEEFSSFCIYNKDLFPIFESRSTQRLVSHDDICWNPLNRPINPEKYKHADISFPGILAEGVPNLTNKKFRLIDGRHRMELMKMLDITESLFDVITQEEFFSAVVKTNRRIRIT